MSLLIEVHMHEPERSRHRSYISDNVRYVRLPIPTSTYVLPHAAALILLHSFARFTSNHFRLMLLRRASISLIIARFACMYKHASCTRMSKITTAAEGHPYWT